MTKTDSIFEILCLKNLGWRKISYITALSVCLKNTDYKNHCNINFLGNLMDGFQLREVILPSSLIKWNRFIHSAFCLMTGSKLPPKRFLHIVQSRASSFKWEYSLLSLGSSISFLGLHLHLLETSISPFIFPLMTCFRRQFLHKMWPIQLAFHFLISCTIFLCSLTLSNTFFFTWSV